MLVTSTNNRARQLIAAGAFAVAAVAAPFAASVLVTAGASDDAAAPACLAWFGNQEDGKCLSYSEGNGVNIGTPEFGLYGPDGAGINTGPLFPGQIIDSPTG